MRMSIVAAAVGAALGLSLGCGKSAPTSPGSNTCSVTLSGSLSGTYNCAPASTAWSSSNNKGGFGFNVATPAISVAIGWTGEPAGGHTYRNTDADASGGASVTTGSGAGTQAWEAAAGGSAGSYTLTLTSVSNTINVSGGKAYTGHGTVDATLVPMTGQSGNITLHATF